MSVTLVHTTRFISVLMGHTQDNVTTRPMRVVSDWKDRPMINQSSVVGIVTFLEMHVPSN